MEPRPEAEPEPPAAPGGPKASNTSRFVVSNDGHVPVDSLPKLRPCTCDQCDPEDGRCRACSGAIATANPLPPSTERFDPADVSLVTAMGFSHAAAQRALSQSGGNIERAVQWVMDHQDDEMLNEPLPGLDEPAVSAEALTPLFSFGVVADVQYADLPVGTNFLKTVQRYYRHSLDALSMAVQSWLRDGPGGMPVAFVAQLGDLIDGKNADHGQTAAAAADVHRVLSRLGDIPIHSAIGNHEVMNWPRSYLHAACVTSEGPTNPVSEIMSASHLRSLAAPVHQQAAAVEVGASEEGSCCSYRASTIILCSPPAR